MTWSFDPTTSLGRVRLLIPDRDPAKVLFTDEELTALLALEDSGVKRAAALALETVASSQALTLKVIRIGDLTTDGAKLSQALVERAGQLREQAEREEAAEGGGFEIAELVTNDFALREKTWKEWLRE